LVCCNQTLRVEGHVQSTAAEKSHSRKDVMDMKQKLEAERARREKLEMDLQALSLQHQAEKEVVSCI